MTALNHQQDKLVVLPFRKTEKDTPDWTVCWKYIQTHHSGNATTAVEETLKNMNALHNVVVKTCTDELKNQPNDNFAEQTLKKYCKYVAMAQSHLPLNEKLSGKLKFFWRDSFDDSIKYESKNSNLELVSCVLNLAATYNYIGVHSIRVGTVEDTKDAFNSFQNAAGYYNMVDTLLDRLPPDQLQKGDLKRQSIDLVKRITLAHAHHAGYLKAETAIKDKHEMLSKIAMKGAQLYDEIVSLFNDSVWYNASSLPWKKSQAKEVKAQLAANKVVMEARAYIHLALKNEAETEMGNAIAYYVRAKDVLRALPKMQTNDQTNWVNSIVSSVNAAHEAADKANNSVYYSRVPKEVPAPESLPRPLGQATEHPSFVSFTSKRGDDPFFGIVPAHIASIGAQWRDSMRKKANTCGEFAKTQRRGTQKNMQKLGVIATVQTFSGENQQRGRVPEPLRSRIIALKGGEAGKSNKTTESLVTHVKTCEELNEVCKSKLKEVAEELEKDREIEKRYLEAYGEKMWRSVYPASEQTSDYNALQGAIKEHQNGLEQWLVNPLTASKKVLSDSLQSIARLDFSLNELDGLMPFSKTKESRQQSEKVQAVLKELQGILEKQTTCEDAQKKYLGELQDTIESDEIIYGLAAVDSAQRDAIINANTKKVNDIIDQVNTHSRELNEVSQQAETVMAKLGEIQSTDPQFLEIQKVTNDLDKACSLYEELVKDLESVAMYASKAVDNIESTLSSAKSYTLSRQLEAEEVQGRLDGIIAEKMSKMEDSQRRLSESGQHGMNSQRPSMTPSYNQPPDNSQRPSMTPSYNQPPPLNSQRPSAAPSYNQPPYGNYPQQPPNAYGYPQQQQQQYAPPPQQYAPPQQQYAPPPQQQYAPPPQQQPDRPPSYDAVMGNNNAPSYQYPPNY
ncbi:programmed cell death 6-interacting protein [Angomonas deanei]|uniref:BRO1-like domain/ALIX V-shaped domain binding to HIV, putative n=1 Tax=Angomonas deanei TaxID=59799 RepID=S9VRH0_9TRYP|nr:programmed cell death 6-interacting protein [Angomonas deanei]EPY43489.1 programmed cell death 6-interacting protein [Angomonas deanei]CAD2215443.1 BRO1-like domain/ALIX V-shaped domain binding to HIV, putative [Angomonas deanei]|eukprot:EPY36814.1 programmed cell death 6-interacting protein [Angomonas deanei]